MKDNIRNKVRGLLARFVGPRPLGLLVALVTLWSPGVTQGSVRLTMDPSQDQPFYARIGVDEVYSDGVWAAVAFYRDPDCIRTDFNLLDFFDIPAAFGCPCYVTGFLVWKNGPPPIDLAPLQSKLQLAPGQTMPVWFMRSSHLQAAIADGTLTVAELAGIPSLLLGEADFFTETLHPSGGEAQQSMISIVATGILEDGRKFSFQATGIKVENYLKHVKIDFK